MFCAKYTHMIADDFSITFDGEILADPRTTFRCDGTKANKCAEAKYKGSAYICPHYNSATVYPELLHEYYPALNDGRSLNSFMPSCMKRIIWRCHNYTGLCDCHQWPATLNERTKKTLINTRVSMCPWCAKYQQKVCPHGTDNFGSMFPEIAKQMASE